MAAVSHPVPLIAILLTRHALAPSFSLNRALMRTSTITTTTMPTTTMAAPLPRR